MPASTWNPRTLELILQLDELDSRLLDLDCSLQATIDAIGKQVERLMPSADDERREVQLMLEEMRPAGRRSEPDGPSVSRGDQPG